jgi:hypothetical protein
MGNILTIDGQQHDLCKGCMQHVHKEIKKALAPVPDAVPVR